MPIGSNILEDRFVLALKKVGAIDESCKARFVVQGHTDILKNMIVHTSVNVRQQTIGMIVAIAAWMQYSLWSQDVSQA